MASIGEKRFLPRAERIALDMPDSSQKLEEKEGGGEGGGGRHRAGLTHGSGCVVTLASCFSETVALNEKG